MEPHDGNTALLQVSPEANETPKSTKVRQKLEGLRRWRVDSSQIIFEEGGSKIEGGFAVVRRASLVKSDEGDGKGSGDATPIRTDVAVKMMKVKNPNDMNALLRRAVREADLIANLDHDNVIHLEGILVNMDNQEIWLLFPWAEMGDLRAFVASADWTVPERIWLIEDVARGVEYLHAQDPPICHGDLKSVREFFVLADGSPELKDNFQINILVTSECRAMITDFGSARRLRQKEDDDHTDERQQVPETGRSLQEATFAVEYCEDSNTMTFTGTQYTLRWVAPEVLEEGNITSTAADIWSMGWVFYEVMTGSIPFETLKRDAAVVMHIANGRLPSLKEHTRMSPILRLVSLMMKCWDLEPQKRSSAAACRQDIAWMPMCVPSSRDVLPSLSVAAAVRRYQDGQMYRLQSDYDKALAAYNNGLELLPAEAIASEERIDILGSIADVHRFRNDYDEAVAKYSEVLRISDEIGNRAGKADALFGLAEVHRIQTDYDAAVAKYSELVGISDEIGNRGRKANALWGLAEVHRRRNDYDEAVVKYSEVFRISDEIGDRAGKADALWGLAEVHRLRENYDEAVVKYSEVARISDEIGDRGRKADVLYGLAEVHLLRNDYDEAVAKYSEGVRISDEIGDRRRKAIALLGLAEAHRLRGDYDEAVAKYSEVVRISDEILDRSGKAVALRGLADVHSAQKDYASSIPLYNEALLLSRAVGSKIGIGYALQGLADVYSDQDLATEAIRLYVEAYETFRNIGFEEDASDVLQCATDLRERLSKGN